MPLIAKSLFTILTFFFGLIVLLLGQRKNTSEPDWAWRFGQKDSFRHLLFDSNGSLKTPTKIGILIIYALFLFLIWCIVPTQK